MKKFYQFTMHDARCTIFSRIFCGVNPPAGRFGGLFDIYDAGFLFSLPPAHGSAALAWGYYYCAALPLGANALLLEVSRRRSCGSLCFCCGFHGVARPHAIIGATRFARLVRRSGRNMLRPYI